MAYAIAKVTSLHAKSVLDIGCGSGPLFAPLGARGIRVVGVDPALAMVKLARASAAKYPDLIEVRQHGWEDIDEVDAYDVAVALGVFDYVDQPADLLTRAGRAAPNVVASFPSPGLRVWLRKVRYGARGVHVHGYPEASLDDLAKAAGMSVADKFALGNAGFAVLFSRIEQ